MYARRPAARETRVSNKSQRESNKEIRTRKCKMEQEKALTSTRRTRMPKKVFLCANLFVRFANVCNASTQVRARTNKKRKAIRTEKQRKKIIRITWEKSQNHKKRNISNITDSCELSASTWQYVDAAQAHTHTEFGIIQSMNFHDLCNVVPSLFRLLLRGCVFHTINVDQIKPAADKRSDGCSVSDGSRRISIFHFCIASFARIFHHIHEMIWFFMCFSKFRAHEMGLSLRR